MNAFWMEIVNSCTSQRILNIHPSVSLSTSSKPLPSNLLQLSSRGGVGDDTTLLCEDKFIMIFAFIQVISCAVFDINRWLIE